MPAVFDDGSVEVSIRGFRRAANKVLRRIDQGRRPLVGFLVQERRVRQAQEIMAELLPQLTEEDTIELASEVGLFDCLSYNKRGTGFRFEMSELQQIAFAAALRCVCEVRNNE